MRLVDTKTEMVRVRVTAYDRSLWTEAAGKHSLSDWIRFVLSDAAHRALWEQERRDRPTAPQAL